MLDRELTYEVDKISIVLPTEVDELKVVDGKDYVTLMTCTPYGINTHRLLVRGHRVTAPENLKRIRVAADATRIEPILIAPLLAVPLLLLLLIGLLVSGRKRKQNEDAAWFDEKRGVFVVADGMGGHLAGEVASQMAIDAVRRMAARHKKGRTARSSLELSIVFR